MNNNTKITLDGFTPVSTLDLDALENLTRNNLKFRDIVYNVVIDNLYDLLQNEYLSGAPFRYSFGCVYSTSVQLDNRFGYGVKWDDLVAWIEKTEKAYCFIDIAEYEKSALELAKQAATLQEKLDDSDCGYSELSDLNYNRIEKKVDSIKTELENRIKTAIDSILDSADDIDYLVYELEFLRDFAFDYLYIDDFGNINRVTVSNVA